MQLAPAVYRVTVTREQADRIKRDRRLAVWSRYSRGSDLPVVVCFEVREPFDWRGAGEPRRVDVSRSSLPTLIRGVR